MSFSLNSNPRTLERNRNSQTTPTVRELIRKAISMSDKDDLKRLLNEHPEELNTYDKDGFTPLIHSLNATYTNCVDTLLNAGADANKRSKYDNYTPLFYAAKRKWSCLSIVPMLIKAGADINAKNGRSGNTALIIASINRSYVHIML